MTGRTRRPTPPREVAAALIAWPSITLIVVGFGWLMVGWLAKSLDAPDTARWVMGAGFSGVTFAIGIAPTPEQKRLTGAIWRLLRPALEWARNILERRRP